MHVRKLAISLLLAVATSVAHASEVKVVATQGVKHMLLEVQALFERETGHTLAFTWGAAAVQKRRIDEGETFDAAVLTPATLADLARTGKVPPGAGLEFARSGVGIAIAKNAPKPDVSTRDALKSALLAAKSIAYSKEGLSGVAAARIIGSLGLTEPLASRVVVESRTGGTLLAIEEAKADLAFALVSEIVTEKAVQFAGPVPQEFQTYVVFSAAPSSTPRDPAAAKAFIDYLRDSRMAGILEKNGMERMQR
jgi:molybdate transport system substrate-binding protein